MRAAVKLGKLGKFQIYREILIKVMYKKSTQTSAKRRSNEDIDDDFEAKRIAVNSKVKFNEL